MEPQPGDGRLDHSTCPGMPCPETVLVVRTTDGSYLLVVYPQGEPAAFVTRADADLLQEALQAAFGYSAAEASNGNGNSTSRNGAVPTKRVQP
jgi:hypothetical protein